MITYHNYYIFQLKETVLKGNLIYDIYDCLQNYPQQYQPTPQLQQQYAPAPQYPPQQPPPYNPKYPQI